MKEIEDVKKTIAEQKLKVERAEAALKAAPGEVKIRQEKILQLVKEELIEVEQALSKY